MIEDVDYTASGYIQAIAPDGTVISRHRQEREAQQACFQHAKDNEDLLGDGVHDYILRSPDVRMSIRLLSVGGNPTNEDTTPPDPPAGVFNNSVTSTGFTTNWTNGPESDLQEHRVYRSSTGPGSGFSLVDTVTVPTVSYSHTGLTAETQYWVYVTALDSSGNESVASSVVSSTTSAASSDPYDISMVPARFQSISFASPPVTTNSVTVSNDSEFSAALVSGNRITMNAGTYSGQVISGGLTDIDIVEASPGTVFFSSQFTIDAVSRVRITGVEFNGNTGSTTSPSLLLLRNGTDITLNQIKTTGGIQMYGDFGGAGQAITRLTILNSDIYAQDHYAVLCGAVNDLIFANNDCSSDVALTNYPTARFVNVVGGIYIDCRIAGLSNRMFRLHEASTLNLLMNTQLETSATNGANLYVSPFQGVSTSSILSGFEMIGCNYYNQFSGITGAPVQVDNVVTGGGRTEDVNIQDNNFFCPDSVATLGTADAPFTVTGNTFSAYTTPPAYTGGRPF